MHQKYIIGYRYSTSLEKLVPSQDYVDINYIKGTS
jgi:hypothetical protein